MTPDGKTLVLYAALAAIVSLGLLVFAWAASDTHVTDVIIGAITGYWLREATYIGRAVTSGNAGQPQTPPASPPDAAQATPSNPAPGAAPTSPGSTAP